MTGILPPPPSPWTVLLVDDDADVRAHLSRALRRAVPSLRILEGANGREGLDLLSSNNVDLIVSDQRMPVMDGITFLTLAAKSAPRVPKILLTGFADVELAVRAVNDGHVSVLLQKPASDEAIAKEALRLLEARRHEIQDLQSFARALGSSRRSADPFTGTLRGEEK